MTVDTTQLRLEASAMKAAVSGIPVGDTHHAANWADKPHRVLYDALNLLLQACEEIDRLNAVVADAPEPAEPIHVSMLTEREAIDAAKSVAKKANDGWDFISSDECNNFEPNIDEVVRIVSEEFRRLTVAPEEFTRMRPIMIADPSIASLSKKTRLAIVDAWKNGGMYGYEYLQCEPIARVVEPAIAGVIQSTMTTTAAPADGDEWSVGHFEVHAVCSGYTIQYKGGPEYIIVPHEWRQKRPDLVQDVLDLLNRKY